MVEIDELNQCSDAKFLSALSAIYEDSPWVAERAAARRPFADLAALQAAMANAVRHSGEPMQLALVRAHPDLAGRLARAGGLAPASAREQAGLGLDRLSDDEFDRFAALNAQYRARFGFPFVIAVARQTRASVLEAFATRLQNDAPTELRTALAEIDEIARFRLESLVAAEGHAG